MEGDQNKEGKMSEIKKFVEFCGGIWQTNKRKTEYMFQMEEVKKLLRGKLTIINQFEISTEKLKKEIYKRQSCTLQEYTNFGGKSQQQPKKPC